jgi:hypothetical protein
VLNGLFSSIDFVAKCIGNVWKVETIGDCYIGVVGGPQPCEDHADRAILLAASILDIVESLSEAMTLPLAVRIAVHSGEISTAVIGRLLPRYLVFGKDMEIVNHLETLANKSQVRVSNSTKALSKWGWVYDKVDERCQLCTDGTCNSTEDNVIVSNLLSPKSERNHEVLLYNRNLYPFLNEFHEKVMNVVSPEGAKMGSTQRQKRWGPSEGSTRILLQPTPAEAAVGRALSDGAGGNHGLVGGSTALGQTGFGNGESQSSDPNSPSSTDDLRSVHSGRSARSHGTVNSSA